MNEKIRLQAAHLFVEPHTTPLRIDAPPLSDGIAAPDKDNVATLGWRCAEMAQYRGTQGFQVSQILEHDAVKDLLAGGQIGQLEACRKVADGESGWALRPLGIGEGVRGGIVYQHTARFVGTTPDRGRIAGHVTAGHAVWDTRTYTVSGHQDWGSPLRPWTTSAYA